MNWGGIRRKRLCSNFKVLPRKSSGGTEEGHEKPQSAVLDLLLWIQRIDTSKPIGSILQLWLVNARNPKTEI
jgi:hypothetical protein